MFLPEITVACFGQLRCLVEFAYLGALWKNVLTRRYSIVARGWAFFWKQTSLKSVAWTRCWISRVASEPKRCALEPKGVEAPRRRMRTTNSWWSYPVRMISIYFANDDTVVVQGCAVAVSVCLYSLWRLLRLLGPRLFTEPCPGPFDTLSSGGQTFQRAALVGHEKPKVRIF